MFLYSKSFADDVTEKERIKRLNFDHRHNGKLWGYYGKFHKWIQEIDNKFMCQKLTWLQDDIQAGFASYNYRDVYFQKHVEQPWINDLCLQYYSNDHMVNFDKTTISILDGLDNELIIPRENYQNIYDPIDITDSRDMVEEHNIYFYDMRLDTLFSKITDEAGDFWDKRLLYWNELKAFEVELEQLEEMKWRGIEIDLKGFEIAPHHFPAWVYEEDDKPVLDYESVPDVNFLLYSPEPYIKLGQIYFEGFEYQEQLSDKAFKVFTKPINKQYQWALSLFASGGLLWHSFIPLLMIIPTNQNRPIKPKNVVYQELYLFLRGYYFVGGNTEGRALQIKKFNYIDRYVNRYIDWMEDKVMAVIESE